MARSDGSQSGGSFIGGLIGATIGLIVGGPYGAVKGFMYGSTIGGILAPPSGPDIVGPRLEDLSIQTSSNVADLPRFDGTMGMYGNMIWAKENKLQEVVTTTTKKKKLLGFTVSKVKTTTYTYYLNCAIAFALMDEEDNCQLLKVWIGDKLVLNRTSDDVGTMLAGLDFDEYFTFYKGTDDQPVDPEIAEDVGILNASAYPGVCYMVIRDLDLTPWGDSAARAQVKVELSSGEVEATDLAFMSQTPVPLHPQYVSNWNVNFMDSEGLHAWKWGTQIAEEVPEADTTWAPYSPYDFDKLHYIGIPSGGGYLKEKFTDIIPREYLVNPATASTSEQKGLRHVSKGKGDINAAVFVTAFVKTSGAGGGGDYPHPLLLVPGQWTYRNLDPTPGFPHPFDTFFEAWTFARTPGEWGTQDQLFTDPDLQDQFYDADGYTAGILFSISESYPAFEIYWTPGYGYPPSLPNPVTDDTAFSTAPWLVTFSVTIVMPDLVKEFIVSSNDLYSGPVSQYVVYNGRFFWGTTIAEGARIYEMDIDGTVGNYHIITGTNFVTLVRIGVVDGQLVVISHEGTDARLRIYDALDLGDVTSYTDYDNAAILSAFGISGQDFIDNCSPDFNGFLYFDDPNVYKKADFAATAELLGDADSDLIPGTAEPTFFNMWRKGSLLGVSTFGGSMPQAGVQFFSVGLLGEPGMAQLADILRKYCLLAGIKDERINTSLINQEVRGHRVAKRGSVRNVIEQLRGCWPFDIVPSGYELKFVPRGTSPVATISHEDLGPDVQWVQDREMTPQIPWRLSLRYLDRDLEYEINEQQSQRPIDSSTEHTLEIPVVFTPDEGAQRVNILHSIFLTERITYSGIQLPPPYRYLEPADVITVTFPDEIYEVRLATLKTSPSGLIEGEGKPNNVAIYTSTATGSTRVPPVQTIPVAGGSVTVLMDLPHIEGDDVPGIYGAMGSVFSNWSGGNLWQQQGNIWVDVQGFAGNCTIGTATNNLTSHSGLLPDYGSTLTVDLDIGALTSVTTEQFYNEEFLVAYGVNGRWEIMACKNAVEDSSGVLTVDTFLRGLRGTEWATGLHQNNDYFISLNDADNAFLELLESQIGQVLTYRGVSKGQDFSTAFNTTITYTGENLKPWSPAKARAQTTDDLDDMLITVTRRDRVNSGWNNFYDIPMSEETEAYVLRIYEDDTYSTLLRTVQMTGATFLYTAAMMTTDFGVVVREAVIDVRQVSAVVGEGHPLRTTVTSTFPSAQVEALYWGLEIGQAVSSTDVGISELFFYDIDGVQIPTTGGTAHASSEFSPTYAKEKAFDGNLSNSWNSATAAFPARIYYQFAAPVAVHSYKIRAIGSGDAPEDFKPIYSDDNVSFNFGTQRTGEVGWSPGTERTFTIF